MWELICSADKYFKKEKFGVEMRFKIKMKKIAAEVLAAGLLAVVAASPLSDLGGRDLSGLSTEMAYEELPEEWNDDGEGVMPCGDWGEEHLTEINN